MTREQARNLISSKIEEITGGLTVNELADSATLCNGLDDMDGMSEEEANNFANEIAQDMLHEEGFPVRASPSFGP
tara:strand:+ start:468 stop:692 length:225 start_codon:yes stop_codon:yes gene_type:complete